MRISDWSSDVCSSDLPSSLPIHMVPPQGRSAKRAIELNLHILGQAFENLRHQALVKVDLHVMLERRVIAEGRNTNEQVGIFLRLEQLIDDRIRLKLMHEQLHFDLKPDQVVAFFRLGAKLRHNALAGHAASPLPSRSEETTSELQSLMRISYAVFCLKKKNTSTK